MDGSSAIRPLCSLFGHLLYRQVMFGCTINFCDYDTGLPLEYESGSAIEWQTGCQHFVTHGLLATYEINGLHHLAEGCPSCRVIRSYDAVTGTPRVVYENVEPNKMCTGPNNNLLVYNWENRSLLHLASDAKGKLHCALELEFNVYSLSGICYCEVNDVVVLSGIPGHITAIDFSSGRVKWEISGCMEYLGRSLELEPEDICSAPNGWICVANRKNVLILNASNGDLVCILGDSITQSDTSFPPQSHPFQKIIWCCDSNLLVVQRGSQIFTYKVTFVPEGPLVLPTRE